jgi:hypothetical protein
MTDMSVTGRIATRAMAFPRGSGPSQSSSALSATQNQALEVIMTELKSPFINDNNLLHRLCNVRNSLTSGGNESAFAELSAVLMDIAMEFGECDGLDAKIGQCICDVLQQNHDIIPDGESSPLTAQEFCSLVNDSSRLREDIGAAVGKIEGRNVFNLFNLPDDQREVAVVYRGPDGTLMVVNAERNGNGLQCEGNEIQRLEDYVRDTANADVPLLILPDSAVPEHLRMPVESSPVSTASGPSTQEITQVEIEGRTYAIPTAALKGVDAEYAQKAIAHGLELLGQIDDADPDTLLTESPIHSRQDMADLMWALDAKAWEVAPEYQSGSGSMYVSDEGHRIYNALKGAKDEYNNSFAYGRGGRNDSSHLKPFKNGKASQFGFDAYEPNQSANAERDVRLPYGKNTLLFGSLETGETGFSKERTFIKLEDFGTDSQVTGFRARWNSFLNLLSHGLGWFKKVFLKINNLTKENDFRENTTVVSKMVSSFCEYHGEIDRDTLNRIKSAANCGLTALAKCIQELNSSDSLSPFLQDLEREISEQLEDPRKGILKEYQQTAIEQWKETDEGRGKSTLAYFATHDQSGKELVLDL